MSLHPRRSARISFALVLAVGLAGCGDDDGRGGRSDSGPGPTPDGGMRMDAFVPPPRDAGGETDAGPTPDGGKRTDGGPRPDASRPDSGPVTPDECPEMDLGMATGMAVVSGTTTDAMNDTSSECGGESAPDRAFLWTAPSSGLWVFDLQGSDYDTMLYLLGGGCEGAVIDCNDDTFDLISRVQADLAAGDVVAIVVDGYDTESGSFTVNINSATTEDCSNGLDDDIDGMVDCEDYDDCDLLPTCHETMCGDGIDNDGDFEVDCVDFDCDTSPGCHESGAMECTDGLDGDGDGSTDCDDYDCFVACSEMGNCSDGVDNDMNGSTDCTDTECGCDPACGGGGMSCPGMDLGTALGMPVTMGYLAEGTCSAALTTCGDVGGGDVSFLWTAPGDGNYQFDTIDTTGSGMLYDHVMEIRDASCSGAALGCSYGEFGDGAFVVLPMVAGQQVVVVIDALDPLAFGYYSLNVTPL